MNSDIWKLTYFSLGHILSIIVPLLLIGIIYIVFQDASKRTQRAFIYTLMIINLIQHVFKAYVWFPLYHGKFDISMSFFCNICGSLIILAPFIFRSRSSALKDAMFLLGNLCSAVSIWFITVEYGISVLSFDYIRYFTCHCILMITSTLPVLFGLQEVKVRNFWVVGILYIAVEILVFLNDFIIVAGRNNWDWAYSYNAFYKENMLFIAHASDVHIFDHTFMEGKTIKYVIDDGTYKYIPILWSAPVIYIFLCGFSALVFAIFKKRRRYDYYEYYDYY